MKADFQRPECDLRTLCIDQKCLHAFAKAGSSGTFLTEEGPKLAAWASRMVCRGPKMLTRSVRSRRSRSTAVSDTTLFGRGSRFSSDVSPNHMVGPSLATSCRRQCFELGCSYAVRCCVQNFKAYIEAFLD